MKKTIILSIGLLILSGISEAQWSFNGTHIYNSNSGNVGIGNSTPNTLLYVGKNTTEPTITVRNFGGGAGATFSMIDDASGADWKFKATVYGGFKIRDNGNGLDVFTVEPNSIANAIYINAAGNVGIRTTTPGAPLSVINTSLSGIATTGSFQIGQSNTNNLVCDNNEVQARVNGAASTLYLQYWGGNLNACASGGTSTFYGPVEALANFNVSGRIGVKKAPDYDLDVSSTDYSAVYIYDPYQGGTVANIIAGGTSSGTWGLYAYATTAGYAGYFSGHVYCTGSYLPSDEILKEKMQPLQNALEKVMKLDVNTYYYKQENAEMNLPSAMQYGFTAQNMETVFPELVKLNPAKEKEQPIEFKAVNYIGLIPILTEAIQEQQEGMEAKQARIDYLEKQYADLQKQFNELQALVYTIQKDQ